jgi:hypothetical protein
VCTKFGSACCETAQRLSREFDVKQRRKRGSRSTLAAMRKNRLGFWFHAATT